MWTWGNDPRTYRSTCDSNGNERTLPITDVEALTRSPRCSVTPLRWITTTRRRGSASGAMATRMSGYRRYRRYRFTFRTVPFTGARTGVPLRRTTSTAEVAGNGRLRLSMTMYGRSRFGDGGLNFVRFRQTTQTPVGRRDRAPFRDASWKATASASGATSLTVIPPASATTGNGASPANPREACAAARAAGGVAKSLPRRDSTRPGPHTASSTPTVTPR